MAREERLEAPVRRRQLGARFLGRELAVVTERDSLPPREIPEVAVRGLRRIVVGIRLAAPVFALVVVAPSPTRVVLLLGLRDVIGDVRAHTPVVPVRAHLGVHQEAVEDPEPLSQRVVVGGDRSREKHERSVTVSLWKIPQHLVVRPVFFEDVDHMLERWIGRAGGVGTPVIRAGDPSRHRSEALGRETGERNHRESSA
ncbi:MAG: hypothetical protein ABI647_26940, partial [Gemmatimonadota bacterium]